MSAEIQPDDDARDQQQFNDGCRASELGPGNSRTYSTVNVADQASAILGDVHINTTDLRALQSLIPQEERRMLLRALYFDEMKTRKVQIDARASSPQHVAWIWRTTFKEWLESPGSHFWITGRPGSGKSTLMAHISNSSRTKQYLATTIGQWKIVHFFFDFRAGKSLGNSIESLLRSLLYQIVKEVPETADMINLAFGDRTRGWDTQICLDNLCDVLNDHEYRFCVFIDGLDESEGSYAELIDIVEALGDRVSKIKLCLASRPYPLFHHSLSRYTTITMQDHNDESIRAYTCAQWSSHRIDHRSPLPHSLSDRIRAKTEGVFLWARLAVDELIIDFGLGKPLAELYAQLESMPIEVGAMYERTLKRLSEPRQQEAAAILYMILQTQEPIAISKIYATLDAIKAYGYAGESILPIICEIDNTRRVLAIIGDLIDQSPTARDSVPMEMAPMT